jgi:hypothetical protein
MVTQAELTTKVDTAATGFKPLETIVQRKFVERGQRGRVSVDDQCLGVVTDLGSGWQWQENC